MRNFISSRAVSSVFVALVAIVLALPAVADDSQLQSIERVLPSGAQALLMPRPGSGTVLVTVVVPAGSQDEPAEMGGMSHYLEHLLFDGFDDLDERGVTESFERLSVYMNAFTREQSTVFFALAPRERAVATAELMAGMLTRSKIVPETYDKEKKVILEELAKDHASPDGLKEEALRSVVWRGTPLQHPVGGSTVSVEATTREEVVDYWKARYVAGGFRILITGDLPLSGLEKVLAPFEKLPQAGTPPVRKDSLAWSGWGKWSAAPAPASEKKPGGMPPMGMGMGHGMQGAGGAPSGGTLSVVIAAPDSLATAGSELELTARWLSGVEGPLASVLVPEWATEVSASVLPRQPRDLVEVRVSANMGVDPEVLLSRLLAALDSAASGPEDGTLMAIQRARMAERALDGQRLHYAAVLYGDSLAAARGPLAESVEPSMVSAESVRSATKMLFENARGRTRGGWLGEGGPKESMALPEAVEVRQQQAVSVLTPGPMGSQVTTLDNGLVVGILPETGSSVFGIHLLVADRTLSEPEDAPGIADFIHRLLPGGTVLTESGGLERRIERLGIEVKVADSPMIPFDNRYHVPDFSYVRIEGPSSSFEFSVQILAEMIRVPAWDEAGWKAAVSSHSAAQKADNRGGEKAAQLFAGALLGADHPLSKPVSGPVSMSVPSEERTREVWGSWPAGYFAPERLVITVASPLPADETVGLIEDAFSGGPQVEPRRGPYAEGAPVTEAPKVEVGEATQVTLLWGRVVEVAAEDRAALLVAADALSDRMVAVIREREGLAYRLSAGTRLIPGGSWIVSGTVGTRPENTERVAELLEELVEELGAEPLSADDLERLDARRTRSRMLRGLSAASRAYRVGRALFEGEGSPLAVTEEAFAEVTQEDVRAAVRKYFDPTKMLLVVTP